MRRSRLMSLMEALANSAVGIGFGVGALTRIGLFPLLELAATLAQNLANGAN